MTHPAPCARCGLPVLAEHRTTHQPHCPRTPGCDCPRTHPWCHETKAAR